MTDISTRLNYEAEQGWQVVAGVSLVYGTHNMYWLVRRTETKQLTFDLTQSAPFLDFIWFGTASLMLAGGDTADRIQSVEQLTVKERPGVGHSAWLFGYDWDSISCDHGMEGIHVMWQQLETETIKPLGQPRPNLQVSIETRR